MVAQNLRFNRGLRPVNTILPGQRASLPLSAAKARSTTDPLPQVIEPVPTGKLPRRGRILNRIVPE